MALIAICVSSMVGFIVGLAHIIFLGATFWQGALTYIVVAFTLTAINLAAAALTKGASSEDFQELGLIDQWDEWHEDEDWHDAELEFSAARMKPRKRAS